MTKKNTSFDSKKILKNLPHGPGIYKMINEEGAVIYIGKAKELSKRIKQYFQKDYQHSTRTRKLLENISNIETIAVDSDLEAVILEHNLIKQLQPKYNVIMKDDKNYVYIKITDEDFPRVQIVRRIEKDNAKYIGPKTAAHKVKDTFKILKKIFPFRHCNLDINYIGEGEEKDGRREHQVKIGNKVIKYPCIDYYIKRCIAPCIGECKPSEYKEIVNSMEKFLNGKADEILENLQKKMQELAFKKEFEKAAKTRDKIKKIEEILERQKVSDPNQEDKDVINYCITQNKAYFNLFQIRDGKLIGQENFTLSAQDIEENAINKEVLEAFLKQYYEIATDAPKEILLPHEIEDQHETEKLIRTYLNKNIKFLIPKIGTKNKLLEMSSNNARIFADRQRATWQTEGEYSKNAVAELEKILNLPNKIRRIECYDISHLSGTETVGSMIVFENGVPKNNEYRKFKLKTVQEKPDDYKSMEEVLTRRFSRLTLEMKYKEYKLKKTPKKADHFILEKDKKIIAELECKKHSEKVTEIINIKIAENKTDLNIQNKIIKEAIKKIKAKRVYLICNAKLKDQYLLTGFEEIKKLPDELSKTYEDQKKKNEIICLAYDKYKHKEDVSFSKIPDLVIIDGGKGQLGVANTTFKKLELQIPHIALAKRLEEIFLPGKENPILLESNNEALKLLQRARDEAHRFAITYNQKLRSKKMLGKAR